MFFVSIKQAWGESENTSYQARRSAPALDPAAPGIRHSEGALACEQIFTLGAVISGCKTSSQKTQKRVQLPFAISVLPALSPPAPLAQAHPFHEH